MKDFEEEISRINTVEEDIKELKSKLGPFTYGGLLKRKGSTSVVSRSEPELNAGQDMFKRIDLLFEDLRRVKVEIEEHLHRASSSPFYKDTYGIKRRLEVIRTEYSNILGNVEKGHNEVKCLKNDLESFDNNNGESETGLDNSSPDCTSNIRSLNLRNIKKDEHKTTVVYQVNTETTELNEDSQLNNSERSEESTLKNSNNDTEIPSEDSMLKMANNNHRSEEQHLILEQSPSVTENIMKLEMENKHLKKQIVSLQEDLLSLMSDLSAQELVPIREYSPREAKSTIQTKTKLSPQAQMRDKLTSIISSRMSPSKSNRQTYDFEFLDKLSSLPSFSNLSKQISSASVTKVSRRSIGEKCTEEKENDLIGRRILPEKISSNSTIKRTSITNRDFKHVAKKVSATKQDDKGIMSIVTTSAEPSLLNVSLKRSQTPDAIKKRLSLKEKEIQSLKDELKTADDNNRKEADRLRSSKISEVDISEKLLQKSYECDEMLEDNIKLRKKIEQMINEIRELERVNLQLSRDKNVLEIAKEKLVEENTELLNRVQSLTNNIEKWRESGSLKDHYEKELKNTKILLNNYKAINTEQQEKLTSMSKEREESLVQTAALEKQLGDMTKQLHELGSIKSQFEDRTQFLERESVEIKKAYERKLTEQSDRLNSAATRVDQLEQKLQYYPPDNIEEEILELRRINKNLNDKLVQQNELIISLQNDKLEMSKQHERLENTIDALANEIECLKAERALSAGNFAEIENELALLKAEKICSDLLVKNSDERAMEMNENKNQLIGRLNELEQDKAALMRNMEMANEELYRVKEENYQLGSKIESILLDYDNKPGSTTGNSGSTDFQSCQAPAAQTVTGTSKPGIANVKGYEFTINNGIRRSKFQGQISNNKNVVESSTQMVAIETPSSDGDIRTKVDNKKRPSQRKTR